MGEYDHLRGIDPELDALVDEFERATAEVDRHVTEYREYLANNPKPPERARFYWAPDRQARAAIGDYVRKLKAAGDALGDSAEGTDPPPSA